MAFRLTENAAVVAISAGIGLCTYASRGGAAEPGADGGPDSTVTMTIGVALLTSALLLSARLGIYQEVLYTTFGKHSQQALFFTHALPLPGFLLLASDIGHHAALFSASEPLALPLLPVAVPRLWFFLACNVVTQYPFGMEACPHDVFVSVSAAGIQHTDVGADCLRHCFADSGVN
ncbi:UDP-xylose and UDP-N-acetylglucosamine transporter-like [Pollicipes pollicipes]|uniref:UDP-xylose and UDP-N-acetylglucosamine transporter-like n=1 Tax=Pollicipes pollicipes TaxID=41117 RepID=UPI0018849BD4|nr:UDP-xylose and UDP-N-acetylglucosamine transporter-like [Pollicipes pollicipes]